MLPKVVCHNAASLDGRMDAIQPDLGLFYRLAATWKEDITLAGCDTLLHACAQYADAPDDDVAADKGDAAANAEIPAKRPDDPRALLVVPDSRGRLRNLHRLRDEPYWRGVLSLCSRATPGEHLDYLRRHAIPCWILGEEKVDLRAALERMASELGARTVRVDSGGTLNGVLLRAGLVNEVSLVVQPTLVGGTSPRSIFRAADVASEHDALPLRLLHVERLDGDGVWLRYEVLPRGESGGSDRLQ